MSTTPQRESATQHAAYDSSGIWGIGDTAAQALAEAEGFFRDRFADQRDPALLATITGLRHALIEPALVDAVVEQGEGYRGFIEVDGVLMLSDTPVDERADLAALVGAQ